MNKYLLRWKETKKDSRCVSHEQMFHYKESALSYVAGLRCKPDCKVEHVILIPMSLDIDNSLRLY